MSFKFEWPKFTPAFEQDAGSLLSSALNRGPRPKVIADDIRVEEINMGTIVRISSSKLSALMP